MLACLFIYFSSLSIHYTFQLEDVSRHSWVTQYVNNEHTPINRRTRLPLSSNRCTPSTTVKRKNLPPPSSMFVICFCYHHCLLVCCCYSICFPHVFGCSLFLCIVTMVSKNQPFACLLACLFVLHDCFVV